MVENKNADGSRLGRGFSYSYLAKGNTSTFYRNKQSLRKEAPFIMPLIFENIGFPAQAGKPKTVCIE